MPIGDIEAKRGPEEVLEKIGIATGTLLRHQTRLPPLCSHSGKAADH